MTLYTGILKGKNLHKCIISNCFLLWKLPAIQIDTYIEDCSEVWFLDSGQYGAGSEGAAHHVAGVGSHTAISTNVKGQPVVGSAESVRYILLTNTHKHRSITMWGVGVTCVVSQGTLATSVLFGNLELFSCEIGCQMRSKMSGYKPLEVNRYTIVTYVHSPGLRGRPGTFCRTSVDLCLPLMGPTLGDMRVIIPAWYVRCLLFSPLA